MEKPIIRKNLSVSIITVVFNGVKHLENTIKSVLDSGFTNLEYIIVDGGSTDGTVEIIKRYSERLFWWTTEQDTGIYDAMNKGWRAARTDSRIMFLGSGDLLLSLPEDMLLFGPDDVIYGNVELDGRTFPASSGFELYFNNSLHHQALLVPKHLHPAPPFDTKFRVYADFDFNQRLLKRRAKFVYCSELRAYAMSGGLSSKKAYSEIFRIVRKNFGTTCSFTAFFYLALRKIQRHLCTLIKQL